MITTFSAGFKRTNYSELPTLDVPVLENPELHCDKCGEKVVQASSGVLFPTWKHADDIAEKDEHFVTPGALCTYCKGETITVRNEAWHTAFDCSRCGGSYGIPMGD